MDFPILDLMDQDGCYHKLLDLLHPGGLACPRCATRDGLNVHRHRPESAVVDYRCKDCRRVFNVFTGTPWQGTHLSPGQILLILRGIAQGVPTAKLAREVGVSRQHLLRLRHAIQARALAAADRSPLPDDQAEADEMYQNAGEKRGCRTPIHCPGAADFQYDMSDQVLCGFWGKLLSSRTCMLLSIRADAARAWRLGGRRT